jgi:ATP/maltotriose-dependent transcriptional regulator MalT
MPEPAEKATLTGRGREVLGLLAAALSHPEICQRLFVNDATMRTHVAGILQKRGGRATGSRS